MPGPRHRSEGVVELVRTVRGAKFRASCRCGQDFHGEDSDDAERQLVQHIRFWAMRRNDPGHIADKTWGLSK